MLKLRHPLTPKIPTGNSIPVTASVTTLFHNRHAKYRKYTESRLRSTTDQPSYAYVPSTSGQRQSMPLNLRHPLTPKNRPEIVFPVTASVTTLFHNRHAKYSKIHRKSASFDDRSATVCPIDFGQRRSMPLKHWQPQMLEYPTGNSNHRENKRHNTFA
jgi:hypothetical protein